MQSWQRVAVVLMSGSLLAGCVSTPRDVTLAREGAALCAVVVTPSTAKEHPRVAAAAQDLRRCLGAIAGGEVPLVTTPRDPKDPRLPLYVGDAATEVFGPPAQPGVAKQGWRLVVSARGVGCIGESDEAVTYAVYELLDRLGCRWYLPGPLGECLPRAPTISLPAMDRSAVPATICRRIWYSDEDYNRRNRLGGLVLQAAHALEGYISKEQRQRHPDWCAEIGGQRDPAGGRICWGNPDCAAAVADTIIAQLAAKYVPSVSLSPGDGISFCECAKCRALDAGDWDPSMNCVALSDRLVHFCNQIVTRVNATYPDVVFGMLAYVQYTRPPLRERPHPKLVPQVAPITYCRAHSLYHPACPSRAAIRPIIEGWGKVAEHLSMYQYAYNLAEVSCPYPMLTQWGEEVPFYLQNHVTFWQPETMPNFASTLPGLYLGLRLAWSPQIPPAAILAEFYTRFYGPAALAMRAHWEAIDAAWAQTPTHAGCGFDHLRRFTPAVMRAARLALEQAAAACETDAERRRVKLADESFAAFERFMSLRQRLAAGDLAQLAPDAEAWLANWARLMASYKAEFAFSPYAASYFRSFFLADQSRPDDNHFVWAYRVRIENQGGATVRLLRRTWHITDARGRTQHVHGPGVVGEQPVLQPGQSFEYTSGTPLETPSGFMVGVYHMVIPSSGENFDVAVPAFSLDSPHQDGRVH